MKNYKETINYVIFGLLTTVVNIVVFHTINLFIFNYKVSTTIAWFVSVLFAYFTNKKFVFNKISGNTSHNLKELFLFIFYRVLSYFIDLVSMVLLIDILFIKPIYSKVLANIIVIIFNYIVSKKVIFK